MIAFSRLSLAEEFRYSPSILHHVLQVDGRSLADVLALECGDPRLSDLTPALNGFLDDGLQAECRQLVQSMATQSVIPLLTCPDDLDLDCTVVVADQRVDVGSITWRTFGLAHAESIAGLGDQVSWYESPRAMTFDRLEYESAVAAFLRRVA